MANKDKSRAKPYKQPTRKSARSTSSNVSEVTQSGPPTNVDVHTNDTASASADASLEQPSTSSHGPSWTDFNSLKKSVSEMHSLLKSLSQKSSSSQLVVENDTNSSVDKANDDLAHGISVDNQIFVTHDKPMEAVNNPTVNFGDPASLSNAHANVRSSEMGNMRDQITRASVNGFLDSFLSSASTSGETRYKEPGRPIDLKVTEKQRPKIWNNQFLELASLLNPQIHSEVELTIVSEPGEPLHFAPSKNLKTINNLGQWCSAFEIFICVYCQKYPTRFINLHEQCKNIGPQKWGLFDLRS